MPGGSFRCDHHLAFYPMGIALPEFTDCDACVQKPNHKWCTLGGTLRHVYVNHASSSSSFAGDKFRGCVNMKDSKDFFVKACKDDPPSGKLHSTYASISLYVVPLSF